MKIFVWNAQGLGSPRAFNILRCHKQDNNPEMMFLMQTRYQVTKLENWKLKLGFQRKLVVNSVGNAGGLCLFCSDEMDVELLSYSQAHIDVRIHRIHKPD